MGKRRTKQFPGAMPEEIEFAKQRATPRYSAPRVDGAFFVACLISLLLVLPPALIGWQVAQLDSNTGIILALLAGSAASVLITFLVARAWLRFSRSDRLFADATITGWFRTNRARRHVAHAREVFDDPNIAPIELHVDRLVSIAHSLEARDARTNRHSTRVAMRAVAVGKQLGLDSDELARVRAAAKLHDIGALRQPNWPNASDAERAKVAEAGAMLLDFTGDRELISAVRHQHEHFDGTGTPDGLSGAAIPLTARIIAVADAYDLAVRERGQRTALAELTEGAGSRFDPDVVDAFVADAQSNPTAAMRGALSGAFPRVAQSAAELVRGTASVAAAASIATTAVVAGGVGVENHKNGSRDGAQPAATAAAATSGSLASATTGDSGGSTRRKASRGKSKGEVKSNSPEAKGGDDTSDRAGGGGHAQADSGGNNSHGSSGEGGGNDSAPPKSGPVQDLTGTVDDTVQNTTQTVDDTVQNVVDTVDETVQNTTDTVDNVVGGLTGNKK